jgi:multidrug efflux pump subunit AcrA (membrane-fusion protein)
MNKTYIKRNFLKRKNKNKTRKIKGGGGGQDMVKPNNIPLNPLQTTNRGKLNELGNQNKKLNGRTNQEKQLDAAITAVKVAEDNLAKAKLNEANAIKNLPILQAATKLAETKLQEARNILEIISPKKGIVASFLNLFKPKSSTQV